MSHDPKCCGQCGPGLLSITNEDDGLLTLRFRDEDAALAFMRAWSDSPAPARAEPAEPQPASAARPVDAQRLRAAFDLAAHLRRQREFSLKTFGPGERTEGVVDHIRKELIEVLDDAGAGLPVLTEWVDVIILAFDGALRTGATPEQIIEAIVAKQTRNEARRWPDWRTAAPGKAIEHVRETEGGAA